MAAISKTHLPLTGLGGISLILGTMGLILSIIPILGIPLSGVGVLFGLAGVLAALLGKGEGFRWSLAGVALSGLALVLSMAIDQTAAGALSTPPYPDVAQIVRNRPFVPPPARPR